jgi:hypothetical protein
VQALGTKRFSAACKVGPSWGCSQPDFSKLAFWLVIDRDAFTGRELCYPTQAKKRLEWGTQPLLLVQACLPGTFEEANWDKCGVTSAMPARARRF